MQSNLQKTNPTNFSTGWKARCAGPESAFVKLEIISFYFLFSMHDLWIAKGILKNKINYTIKDMHFQGFRKGIVMKNNKLLFNLICKLILQKWIINFIIPRYLKIAREMMYVHMKCVRLTYNP